MSLDRIRVLKTGGRRLLAGLIAALACLTGCSEAPTRVESASLVLEGCRVITMRSSDVLEGVTIVVDADTIAAMGSDGTLLVPDSVPRLDCKGDFVLPGLTDAHVHIGHPTELISYLLSGVTTVFNLGGDHIDLFSGDRLDVLQLQDSVAAGRYPGPTIYSAGQALDGDPPTGPYQLGLASAEEAAEAVRQQFERGFDFIKVYDGLDETVHTAIVTAATELNLPVFGHVPEAIGVQGTLESGQKVITHVEEFYPVLDTAQDLERAVRSLATAVARAGVVVIPNGGFIQGLIRQLEDLDRELGAPGVEYLAPAVRVWWDPQYNYYVNRDDPGAFLAQNRHRNGWIQQLVPALHSAGVLLLSGSDASIPVALPGPSLHGELAALVESGLSPFEAIATATTNVDSFMAQAAPGARPFGTVRVGARADLIILAENPLIAIGTLEAPKGLVVRGEWMDVSELRRIRDRETAAFRRR